jgi:hypothetical protein
VPARNGNPGDAAHGSDFGPGSQAEGHDFKRNAAVYFKPGADPAHLDRVPSAVRNDPLPLLRIDPLAWCRPFHGIYAPTGISSHWF